MTTRQKNACVLVAVVALAVAGFVFAGRGGGRGRGGEPSAFDCVPEATFVVASLDARSLSTSALAAPLASFAARAGGLRGAEATCGFDPLTRLEELVVAVPEAGDSGEFGVVMRAAGSRDELAECARKVIAARGGDPSVRRDAAWTRVADQSVAGTGRPELVFDDAGHVFLGRGPWLDEMLATASGARPSIGRGHGNGKGGGRGAGEGANHAELRRALGPAHALAITALLPQALRDRLRAEMSEETAAFAAPADGGSDAAGGGNAGGGNAAMAGVLGVKAAALGVGADDHGATEIKAELRCETDRDCAEVKRLLEKKREAWAKDVTLRLVGLGGLVDGLTMEARGDVLALRTRLPSDEAARLIERLIDLRFPKAEQRPPPPRDAPVRPVRPVPDEVIRAPGKPALDGGGAGR